MSIHAHDAGTGAHANGAGRLLEEYVDICNRAIAENEDRFVFRHAKKLNRALWGESKALVTDRRAIVAGVAGVALGAALGLAATSLRRGNSAGEAPRVH